MYCHCSQCRRALGADYATLVGAAPEAVTLVQGEIKSFATGKEDRHTCAACHATVFADLHHLKQRAIYNTMFTTPNHGPGGAITGAAFKPTAHIFYNSGITHVTDGLPKFVNLPTAFGGSGEELNDDYSPKKTAAAEEAEAAPSIPAPEPGTGLWQVISTFVVKPELWDEFAAFLKGPHGLALTRGFAGNRHLQASIDSTDPHTIIVTQLWLSKAHRDAYMAFRTANGLPEMAAKYLRVPVVVLTSTIDHIL